MTALDDATVAALDAALAASPDNDALRLILLKARHARGEDEAALTLLGERGPSSFADVERATVGAILLDAGAAERSLAFLTASTSEALLLRARALLQLDRREEAKLAYADAVRANPTLEDKGLEAQLGARVFAATGPTKLRVLANDDTDDSEVDRLLHPEIKEVTFQDVGGLDEVKKQIEKRIILPFQKPTLFQKFKKKVGGGILLYGPPGCGKTLLARATAGECKAQFFNVAIEDVLDMYIGESERKLHTLFERAREKVPSVLFFDEIEALGGKRQFTREGTSSKLVSQFLSEMDGFTKANSGVLILGATNVPWAVDAAFRRPGRFDRVLFVPPPDKVARLSILTLLFKDRPVENVDVRALAEKTAGYSGADLEHLVETAADLAIDKSLAEKRDVPISNDMALDALKTAKATTLEWLTTARNYAKFANEGGQYDEVLEFLRAHGKA
jgi:SpoVK/Ycf46/Vps4 family AAA+-type ATPase